MIATGLLLPIAGLVASAQPWAESADRATGPGTALSRVGPETGPETAGPLLPRVHIQVADPVRLRIPAIGVDAPIDPLDLDGNGVLPPPDSDADTGWWRDGPEPGERGPAVIVGHVDSYQGPAVFIRLEDLAPGDRILVDRADGSTAVFVTRRTERHSKDAFPTQAVYGNTPDAELRLITCGGDFDHEHRRYLDNVIAYAVRSG